MTELNEDVRRRVTKEHQQKTVSLGSNPKLGAAAGVEAFRKCRPILKKFILEIEDGLYSKGIISEDTHDDIHGQSIIESEKKRILLDAVENKLRTSDSCYEFDVILDLFKEEPAHNIVAKRLSKTRERSRSLEPVRKPLFKSWNDVILTAILTCVLASLFCCVVMNNKIVSEKTSRSKFLKIKYNTSTLMLGPGYSTVPFVNLSIFQSSGPDWMTGSHEKQEPHSMTSQPVLVEELLNVNIGDRILIIGGPGTGKTRLTLEIMRMWTNSKVLLSCELLFVYRLRWFSLQKKDIDLKSIVTLHMEGGPVVDEIVNEAFSTAGKKLCFLFDGLDEYEPGYSDMDNYIYLLLHRQALLNAVVIVTTRNITSTGFEAIEWNRQYHVTGFSDEQLKHFLQSSMQTHKEIIVVHSSLWHMCKLPLYASLFVNAFNTKHRSRNIYTATDLFTEITIKTFESDLKKSNEPGKIIKIKDLKHLLEFSVITKICSLAFRGSWNTPRQYSFIDSEVPPELKWTNLSFFQIEPQPGAWNMEVYTFIHPTLMDFLAAVHLTSLSEHEQEIATLKYCKKVGIGYDDLWYFVCGLTSYFKSLINLIQKGISMQHLTMAHCVFEAQSHSAHEVESAACYLMQEMKGCLIFTYLTLSVYDMQAIGFLASASTEDLEALVFYHITFADDLSLLFYFLAKSDKIFPSLSMLHFTEVYEEVTSKELVTDFFKYTPRLFFLILNSVSESLLQLALLAPPSCKVIFISATNIGTSSGITPYSLINQHHESFSLINCKVKDHHLSNMRSIPWSVKTKVFGLKHNYIGNEGAISLARSFENSAKMSQSDFCGPLILDLQFNNISGEGLVALLKTADIFCSKTLHFLMIDLTGNEVADNDVASVIKACHGFVVREIPIAIRLLDNKLTEDGQEKLRNGISGSPCFFLLEEEVGWFSSVDERMEYIFYKIIAPKINSLNLTFLEHNIQSISNTANLYFSFKMFFKMLFN